MQLIQNSYAEVNLDNLVWNLKELKKVSEGKEICCVIKANAYGHGQLAIARTLEEEGLDYFAVSSIQEAMGLRKGGIKGKILLLSPILEGAESYLFENDLEMTVYSYQLAKRINECGKKLGKKLRVHIKIDTGMNRIGFKPVDKSVEEILEIKKLDNLEIVGISTHFACADEDTDFNQKQINDFNYMLDRLQKERLEFKYIHTDNTSARLSQHNKGNLARIGIGLYGIYPSDFVKAETGVDLRPVMSLYTYLTDIKTIEKGESVSYGRKFIADKTMKIGTVGIGYADGIYRALSNKMDLVHGEDRLRALGSICMDQLMVDLDGVDAKIGDRLEVFGEKQSVRTLADLAGTIPYEILSTLTLRVPRIYVKDGKVVDELWYMV